jgi:hypothetical protein
LGPGRRALRRQGIVGVVAEPAIFRINTTASVEARRVPQRIVALVAGGGCDDVTGLGEGIRRPCLVRHEVERGVYRPRSVWNAVDLDPHPVGVAGL